MALDEGARTHALGILRELGGCPAVPYMEGTVAASIQKSLEEMGVSMRRDRYGNLIAHHAGPPSRPLRGEVPPIAFVAHMDHPGFEAVELLGDTVIARSLGGVPRACFTETVPVQLLVPNGDRLAAETAGAPGPVGSQGPADPPLVSLRLKKAYPLELPVAVVLDLPDFYLEGDLIHMRALDDLAGCASILAALRVLVTNEGVGDVYGIFTRAEEVGLVGARLVAEEGTLPMETLVVSLEASRTLPGANIGEGPVIRVGDASFTFDAEAEGVLLKAREELIERDSNFTAQRQLMSGGTCEASAFRYFGYRATGIAYPLGNYHNATPEGAVGAEHIHVDDFTGGIELIIQAARSVAGRRESRPWRQMGNVPKEQRQRLAETAGEL